MATLNIIKFKQMLFLGNRLTLGDKNFIEFICNNIISLFSLEMNDQTYLT